MLAGGALVAAAVFGAADQYLGVLYSPSLTAVSGMSAPWLLLPFVAGACQPGRGRAALLGLAVTWVAVGGYVLMIVSPVEGVHLTVRAVAVTAASQWPWFLGGLVSGPVYGLLGYLCRTRRSWPPSLRLPWPEPGLGILKGRRRI